MKKIFFLILSMCSYFLLSAQDRGVTFYSNDSALELAFQRAKAMALSYKGKPEDPVGPWYESALPPRSAFCMRDVSHQSIAGEVLGLHKENENMFGLFAKNISKAKDWCSFWEINHLGEPAADDYRNDKEFWYNLNANFDLLTACWKMYLWTGDTTYINANDFAFFHEKSVTDFIKSWTLQVDSLLTRPTHPNAPVPFNANDSFHRCRGLPSYSEGVPNIKMGIDLVAAIYSGLDSYANILELNKRVVEAEKYRVMAQTYKNSIENIWWNEQLGRYHTFYSDTKQFGVDEGETFLLWFDALNEGDKKEKTIQHLLNNKWNVENLSYFPLIMYQNKQEAAGYKYLLHLTNPNTKRVEYPEVSFGVIKGFTEGLMGVQPDARYQRITTLYRGKDTEVSELRDIPILNTSVSIKHEGKHKSTFTNSGKTDVYWQPEFTDKKGNIIKRPLVNVKANGGSASARI